MENEIKEYRCECGAVFFGQQFLDEHVCENKMAPEPVNTMVIEGSPVSAGIVNVVTARPESRTRSTEYRIIANSDGKMVCESGPCLCGAGRREWHDICLKQ